MGLDVFYSTTAAMAVINTKVAGLGIATKTINKRVRILELCTTMINRCACVCACVRVCGGRRFDHHRRIDLSTNLHCSTESGIAIVTDTQ
jgi:hypothetical protein